MKKRIIGILLILIIAGLVWFFFFRDKKDNLNELTLYGNVDIRQVNLSFRVPGKIQKMYFDEGERVKAGQIVAKLDQQPYLDELATAKAELQNAEANLLKLRTGNRPQEIESAAALVQERQAAYNNAKILYERQLSVVDAGAVSLQSLDDAKSQLQQAEERLNSSKDQLSLAKEGFRKEDIMQGEAQVAQAKARLQTAETNLNDTEIIAPNEGIVLTRIQEEGAVVPVGSPAYTLSLVSPVWIRTYINEPDLGKVHPDMKALVYTDSHPDKPYEGHIGFISPVAEFTPKNVETTTLRTDLVYRLRVVVDNPDEYLRQGMPVTVRINLVKENDR